VASTNLTLATGSVGQCTSSRELKAMIALTENPRHIDLFDKEAEPFRRAGLHQPTRDSQNTSNGVRALPPFYLHQWCRGKRESIICRATLFGAVSSTIIGELPTRQAIFSVDELDENSKWDLGIL
jgi:hypothetical protein